MQVDGQLTAADLKLPAGVTLVTDPETVLVHCVEVREEAEEGAGEGAGAEPEVIGRKAGEDEEGEE